VQSWNRTEYFIAALYDDDGKLGSVDDSCDCLRWGDYDDLKVEVDLIRKVFDKPLLRVVDGDHLVEVASTQRDRVLSAVCL
jgi:hypothetical protein